jgi:hypothetical protein
VKNLLTVTLLALGMPSRWIDTALDAPHGIVPWQTPPAVSGSTYRAEARAMVVLFAGG